MLQLPVAKNCGVETADGCNCHCHHLAFLCVARVHNAFVMIVWTSGLGMGLGRLSRPLRGVGVQAMSDAELDTV